MSDLWQDIAAFPPADRDRWKADVERSLKGRAFDAALVSRTPEGLAIDPLYTRSDRPAHADTEAPGVAPFVRGWPGLDGAPRLGWTRGVEIDHPDTRSAHRDLIADLEGGAERALIRVVSARTALAMSASHADALAASARGGVWIDTPDDLAAVLDEVQWPLAPVAVIAPPEAAFTAQLFNMCTGLRAAGGPGLGARVDLIAIAETGVTPDAWLAPYRDLIVADARRTQDAATPHADARPLWINTAALRCAGGHMAHELAAALGAFIAAVRALEPAGLTAAEVLRATEFHLSTGNDFFGEIAKLRAFRRAFALVLDTLGLADRAVDVLVSASTAEDTLSRRDVHVNLLRTTAQATAAAIGGADAVMVRPFDARLGSDSPLGRRLARNLHALLAEESDIALVADPAGGSFYLEHRTEQLAETAWQQFTAWEATGGVIAAYTSGALSQAIDVTWQARAARLRTRKEPVLGVSVFPLATDSARQTPADVTAFIAAWRARTGVAPAAAPASAGAVHYLDADFDTLRRRTDALAATGTTPAVFGVTIGPLAEHAARLDWIRDLVAVAGLRLHVVDTANDMAAAMQTSGAATAIVIAADARHGEEATATVTALRTAGISDIIVAGRPAAHEATLRAAGVTHFIYAGMDVIPWLTSLVTRAEAAHGHA